VEKKSYRVIIYSDEVAEIKNFRVSRGFFKGLLLSVSFFLAAVIATAVFFGYMFFTSSGNNEEISSLRQLVQLQKIQIQSFKSKIQDVGQLLGRLRQLDTKLRVMTKMDEPMRSEPVVGVGGPEPADLALMMNLDRGQGLLVRKLHADLDRLQYEGVNRERSLQELKSFLEDKRSILSSTPSIWPTRGWVTSGFGFRISPFTGGRQMHDGIDVATRVGTPVVAPADGMVTFIGRESGFGKVMTIDHGYGIVTRYAHLARSLVKTGQKVKRGDRIAEVGNTGRSTGPHLHYEVRVNGIPVNPHLYILD